MRFAPVLPVGMYELVDYGDYHLVQAYLLEEDPIACGWVETRSKNKAHIVILDNGAAELGRADPDVLLKLAAYLHPDEVVCPDVLNDADETVRMCMDYVRDCYKYADRVMLVPQGSCIEEWVECCIRLLSVVQEFRFKPVNTVIGVTKFIEKYPGGRYAALCWLFHFMHSRKHEYGGVHCLGCYQSFVELAKYAREFRWLRGCDTTWPYVNAYWGRLMDGFDPGLYYGTMNASTEKFPVEWQPEPVDMQLITRTELNVAVCRHRVK